MTRPLLWKRLATPHPWAGAAALVLAALVASGLTVFDGGLHERAWPFVSGLLFGVALQRGELSLVRAWRDLLFLRDNRQLLALLAAFGVATALTLGGVALSDRLEPPPGSRITPVGWALVIGAFLFGVGAVLARGSLMVHLRRLGEGSLVAIPALLATFLGFFAGMIVWPFAYPPLIEGRPALWLPDILGASGALTAELAALAALALLVWRRRPPPEPAGAADLGARILLRPWPPIVAGVGVGLIAAVACAVGEPLGLTGEGLAVARRLAVALGLAPAVAPELTSGALGLTVADRWLSFSGHAVIVAGVICGSFAAALASGRFSIAGMTAREAAEMTAGGFLIGFGATLALGTVTGAALSGIAVGAASGWVFLACSSAGIVCGLALERRPEMTAAEPPPPA